MGAPLPGRAPRGRVRLAHPRQGPFTRRGHALCGPGDGHRVRAALRSRRPSSPPPASHSPPSPPCAGTRSRNSAPTATSLRASAWSPSPSTCGVCWATQARCAARWECPTPPSRSQSGSTSRICSGGGRVGAARTNWRAHGLSCQPARWSCQGRPPTPVRRRSAAARASRCARPSRWRRWLRA